MAPNLNFDSVLCVWCTETSHVTVQSMLSSVCLELPACMQLASSRQNPSDRNHKVATLTTLVSARFGGRTDVQPGAPILEQTVSPRTSGEPGDTAHRGSTAAAIQAVNTVLRTAVSR